MPTRPWLLVCLLVITSPQVAFSQGPAHIWSHHIGGPGGELCRAIALDASDNVIVAGYFSDTVDVGGGEVTSAGAADIFLVKYDADGNYVWAQTFGGPGPDDCYAVAVDGADSVLVTGYFSDSVDFGGGALTSAGVLDVFLAKYGPDGSHVWSRRFGGTSFEGGTNLAVDASGIVVLLGWFGGTADFGGGTFMNNGFGDIFLAMYGPNGDHIWSQPFGGSGGDTGHGVAMGGGIICVTGLFSDAVDFGGGPLVSNAGSEDMFVAAYALNGAHIWSQRFGSSGNDAGRGVGLDASGNVIVGGTFQGSVDFGGGPLVSSGLSATVLAKYSPVGNHIWSHEMEGGLGNDSQCLSINSSGNVALTGSFSGVADFNGTTIASAGNSDIFMTMFDASGQFMWVRSFGGTDYDYGEAVTFDSSDNVFLTGWFTSPQMDIGGPNMVNLGNNDAFIGKYGGAATGIPAFTNGLQISVRAYPNPFNPAATIEYSLARNGLASLQIFDVNGRLVDTLVHESQPAGEHVVTWEGRDTTGTPVVSGIYFVRLASGNQTQVQKLVLLK